MIVGASVTLFVEQLRTEGELQKRLSEWKLTALTKLGDATDKLDREFGDVLTVRLEDLNRNDRIRTVYQLNPKAHALRQHTLVSGPYLGDKLSKAATSFREATAAIAALIPEWVDNVDVPLDQTDRDRLRDELKGVSRARVTLFENMEELRNAAIIEAITS